MNLSELPPRRRPLLAATAVALLFCAILLATSPLLPMGWDEGDTIVRARGIERWLGDCVAANDKAVVSCWSSEAIAVAWPYTIVREGHPPLAGIVVALGELVAPEALSGLTIARFGPILFFSLAAGAMFYRLWRTYTPDVAVIGAAALVLFPRLFAHAHFATLDGPLTSSILLAWSLFAPALRKPGWALAWGAALGLTLSAKFSGWLYVAPFVLWVALYRDRAALRALLIGLPMAGLTFYLLNPPLWHAPLAGIQQFFDLNLHRGRTPGLNVSTQFLGGMYNLDYPAPWYNTIVWTLMTVPPMPLLFAGVGIWWTYSRWRSDPQAVLLVLLWLTLLIARAVPGVPPHDAERLFLPSFAFLAALVGVGAGRMLFRETLLTYPKIIAQRWAIVALCLACFFSSLELYRYAPQWLSYYNWLVGGVRGATALGCEPTYYWDSLDRPVLDWLHEHTATNEKIQFAAAPPLNLALMREWDMLQRGYRDEDPGAFRWYVLQRRPSGWSDADLWLINHAEPAYQKTVRGAALLDVYRYEDYQQAQLAETESIE